MFDTTLECYWTEPDDAGNYGSRYDHMPDTIALSSGRICALSGGHAVVRMSPNMGIEYISDDCEPTGYRAVGFGRLADMEEVIG